MAQSLSCAIWYNVHQFNQNDYCTCSISVFSFVVFASLGDTKKLWSHWYQSYLLYLVTTAVALIIALGLASVLQPGRYGFSS
mgnify:CR=1 FL=1